MRYIREKRIISANSIFPTVIVPAGSRGRFPLFRSSCSLQTLGHFTLQLKHKERVQVGGLQCLLGLNGGFRFSDLAAVAKSFGCFTQSNETKSVSISWAPTSYGFKQATSAFHRSSCDSQKLRYFTLSPEHKGRVLVQEFQYLRF